MTVAVSERARTLRGWRLAILLLGIVFALHVPMFTTPVWDNDETFIATVAEVMSRGGGLYVDVFDRKPPVVFLVYQGAFALTGTTELWAPRLAGVASLTATAALVAAFARRRYGDRAGTAAGVLAALSTATLLPRDAQSANFEVFMLPAIAAAMVLADRERPGWAGIALGVAACVKQTALTTLAPLAWLAWRDRTWQSFAKLGAGSLAPLVVAALWFGPGDFVFWVFTGNEGYLDVGGAWGLVLSRMVQMTLWVTLLNIVLVVLAGTEWRHRRRDLDVWLWLLSGLVGAFAGLRFWGHYYWQVLPPLCVLAAGALVDRPRWLAPAAVGATAAIAVGAVAFALLDPDVAPAEPWRPIADYVEDHTGPEDRVFVWGHVPEVYWASDRIPATQLVTTGFLTGHTGGRPPDRVGMDLAVPGVWDDFMERLESEPPAMILVMTDSGIRSAEHYPPEDFPRFDDYLREHYERVDRVNGAEVYEPR